MRRQYSRTDSGQVVVEYTLLLGIGVMIAFLITTTLVSRDPNAPGFIISKWAAIIQVIGQDSADDLN